MRKFIEAFLNLLSSAVNHPDNLLTFWIVTVILLSSKKGRGCDSFKFHSLTIPEEGVQIPESYQKFGFLFHFWDRYEEWTHSYIVISNQYYLSLVQHFRCFVVLGFEQHSLAPKKGSYKHLIGLSYVEFLVGKNIIN